MPSARRAASSARYISRYQWHVLPTLSCSQHDGIFLHSAGVHAVTSNPLKGSVSLECPLSVSRVSPQVFGAPLAAGLLAMDGTLGLVSHHLHKPCMLARHHAHLRPASHDVT